MKNVLAFDSRDQGPASDPVTMSYSGRGREQGKTEAEPPLL